MLIVSQNKEIIVNMNNVSSIQLDCIGDGHTNEIFAYQIDEAPNTLGVYITEERAKEVFLKIAENEGACNVFYMPEE